MGDYYTRQSSTHTDGTETYASGGDTAAQESVAGLIEQCWGPHLSVRPFGRLSHIDYYAERHGRLAALLEIKSRSHASTHHETVWLNVRKWFALQMGSVALQVPAYFFAKFTDEVRYIDVQNVDARRHSIGGTWRVVKSRSDIEPVIEVSVEEMHVLRSRQPR